MEWWHIVLIAAIVAGAGVAGEVYVRLAPQRRRVNEERRKLNREIKESLERDIIAQAKAYRSVRLGKLQEAIASPYIRPNLAANLVNLVALGNEYGEWQHESYLVIRSEVRGMAEASRFRDLNHSLSIIVGGDVDGVLSGYEGHFSEPIYQALYGGDLTFEIGRTLF